MGGEEQGGVASGCQKGTSGKGREKGMEQLIPGESPLLIPDVRDERTQSPSLPPDRASLGTLIKHGSLGITAKSQPLGTGGGRSQASNSLENPIS